MTALPNHLLPGFIGLSACILLLLFRRPVKLLLRLLARSGVGLAILVLFSRVGHLIGVTLGVNPVNALILGLLGVPGFGLLLMLQWLLK